jgi:hypothetical protein
LVVGEAGVVSGDSMIQVREVYLSQSLTISNIVFFMVAGLLLLVGVLTCEDIF